MKASKTFYHSTIRGLTQRSASYVTAAFKLTSGHLGFEIKILYPLQCCTAKYTNAQPLVEGAPM